MTDKSRVWADDDPRRRVDEAADRDVAAAEKVSAMDDHQGAGAPPEPATTPPGVLNDDAGAEAEAADKTSLDVDPLSEREAVDPDFDAGSLGPTSDMLAEDEPDLGEKAAAPAAGAYVGTRRAPGRGLGHVAEHDTDDWWRTWLGRTIAVLGAVLVLATGMIWAWIGGLHSPQPKNIPVAVVASDPVARAALVAIRQNTHVLEAKVYSSAADASSALNKHKVDAILASDATLLGGGLNLTVASGSGPGVADTVATTIGSAAQNVNVPLAIEDVYPLSGGDSRGLTPFWLTLAWILGGLLAAVALGIAIGTVPRDLDRLGMRLGALAVFSLLLGLLGALFAGPFLDVWHEHTVGLWLAGSLITFTAALIASAMQSWLGLWGVGIATVLMLVLGVPGSGGPVAAPFLPGFFRGMPRWLPNGLGTDLVRGVEYFGRNANTWSITGLTLWSLASVLALLGATAVLGRRARAEAHQRAATPGTPAAPAGVGTAG